MPGRREETNVESGTHIRVPKGSLDPLSDHDENNPLLDRGNGPGHLLARGKLGTLLAGSPALAAGLGKSSRVL